jgi:ATP-dependent RNA helicase DDX31/DBP7
MVSAVLIATDVASRGLDLPNVETIVQFSPPGSAREYVQRVGRTARKGDAGQSLLFLLPSEGKS